MNILNRYTLITGGTEGIGLELAKLFSMDKRNLIIVARNEDKLEDIKIKFKKEYKIIVEIIQIDLCVDKFCEKIIKTVEEKRFIVDNLINNTSIGSFGFFGEAEDGFEEKLININIIASTAAFTSGSKMSIYYSSKAYVLSLTEALHDEVKDLGIRISCLCPGPVKTLFKKNRE